MPHYNQLAASIATAELSITLYNWKGTANLLVLSSDFFLEKY